MTCAFYAGPPAAHFSRNHLGGKGLKVGSFASKTERRPAADGDVYLRLFAIGP